VTKEPAPGKAPQGSRRCRRERTSSAVPANVRAPWRAFIEAVEARLAAGARAYGDASLRRLPVDLAAEVEQELLDVAGWGFLLWVRIRGLRGRLIRSRRPTSAGRGMVKGSRR
jgi:hypothetical protein